MSQSLFRARLGRDIDVLALRDLALTHGLHPHKIWVGVDEKGVMILQIVWSANYGQALVNDFERRVRLAHQVELIV